MSLIVSFRGIDAENGHIEAFAGIESAAGITRTLTLIAHYASTGTVRHRFPFDQNIQFYLEHTESGSFNLNFKLTILGPLALGLATSAIYDLTKLAINKAIGFDNPTVSAQISDLNETKHGDIDALVEAIEPALKKSHYGIGETADQIVIINGNNNQTIVTFDKSSKNYLMQNIDRNISEQDVSISALNVNDKTGRAYFLDLKRTIPFKISKDSDEDVVPILSEGLYNYANDFEAPIRITFRRIEASDGRLKRIIIFKAVNITEEQ